MSLTNLIPWRRERSTRSEVVENPIELFQRDMNRLFDEFFGRSFGLAPMWGEEGIFTFSPRVDVVETDKEIKVSAELPGMDENDIELRLDDNVLTIRGEKKQEKEEKDKNYYRAERVYGTFQRAIVLPAEVDADKAEALFKNGVLTVRFPKTTESRAKKISIKRS